MHSHKPGDRLPLLSARPAVTFPAAGRPVPTYTAWRQILAQSLLREPGRDSIPAPDAGFIVGVGKLTINLRSRLLMRFSPQTCDIIILLIFTHSLQCRMAHRAAIRSLSCVAVCSVIIDRQRSPVCLSVCMYVCMYVCMSLRR